MRPHDTRRFVAVALPAMLALLALSGCRHDAAEVDTTAETVTFLDSGAVLPSGLPFSEAVRIGDLVHLSGQIGNAPGTLTLVDGGMAGEARQVMENIRTALEAHGLTMQHIVKCTVMLADMTEWSAFNEIYRGYFAPPYPARSAFGANGLALGARVEVECVAHVQARRT